MHFSQETWTSISSIKLIWALLSNPAPSKDCATRNKNWKNKKEQESCFFIFSILIKIEIRHIWNSMYGYTLYTYFIVDDSIFQLSEKVSTFSERYDSPEGKEGMWEAMWFFLCYIRQKFSFFNRIRAKGGHRFSSHYIKQNLFLSRRTSFE